LLATIGRDTGGGQESKGRAGATLAANDVDEQRGQGPASIALCIGRKVNAPPMPAKPAVTYEGQCSPPEIQRFTDRLRGDLAAHSLSWHESAIENKTGTYERISRTPRDAQRCNRVFSQHAATWNKTCGNLEQTFAKQIFMNETKRLTL